MSRSVQVDSGRVRLIQNINVGAHSLQTDEGPVNGGQDAAPNADELLLAALGACASTTVQLYAQRKGWPVEAVRVRLAYAKAAGSESNSQSFLGDSIELEIAFEGELSLEQRQRLFEIAGRCPVHRLLSAPVPIHSSLLTPA